MKEVKIDPHQLKLLARYAGVALLFLHGFFNNVYAGEKLGSKLELTMFQQ